MKKIIILLSFAFSLQLSAQSCEEREGKLLELNGGLSAGFVYNTYAVIGSLADGFGHEAYDKETITNLLEAQKKLASNMINMFNDVLGKNILTDQDDKDYLGEIVNITKGFIIEIDAFLKYVQNKTQRNLDAFQSKRSEIWKRISKLMGIEE
jgi:hypothetical protein